MERRAFRRSELVSLDVADVRETNDGLIVTLRASKTDQAGEGTKKGIPYGSTPHTCPVRAVRAWKELGITPPSSLVMRKLAGKVRAHLWPTAT